MSLIIEDGKGNCYKAQVDSNNRLVTQATTLTAEHFTSHILKDAYFATTADTADTLTATATGGYIFYLKNIDPDKELVIQKISISVDTADGVLSLIKNPTLGTIGNEATHVPVNMNFGSIKESTTLCYTWDEVGDGMTGFTSGTKFKTFILPASAFVLPVDGFMVLPQGTSLGITYTGKAGEIELGVRFYMEESQ